MPINETISNITIEENIALAQVGGGFFNFLNKSLNFVFGDLVILNPLIGLIVVSFILTLLITLAYKFLTKQHLMKEWKDTLKDYQKQIKENKHDHQKVLALQKPMMEVQMKYMMHSFRPLLFTFLPLILVFNWLRTVFQGIDLNFLWFIDGWIWAYVITSVVFSIIIRKILKVH